VSAVPAPQTSGTIAFALRGDVYVLREGKYGERDVGRSLDRAEPCPMTDARCCSCAPRAINGKRPGRWPGHAPRSSATTDIVKKDPSGGTESIVLSGLLTTSPDGFHIVAWYTGPAISPDASGSPVTTDAAATGASDLEVFDLLTGKRVLLLSQGSNLADQPGRPTARPSP